MIRRKRGASSLSGKAARPTFDRKDASGNAPFQKAMEGRDGNRDGASEIKEETNLDVFWIGFPRT